MQAIIINANSTVAQSIHTAAASLNLDPSAFATGLLYAAYQKRKQSDTSPTPAPAPAPAESQPSTPATR